MAMRLARTGWDVIALSRSEPSFRSANVTHVPYDLTSACEPKALEGADTLIHAAYDFGCTRWHDIARVNIDGTRRLLTAARAAGVTRIVCVSTVSAFPGTRSMYGRAKLEIERMAMDMGSVVIRAGLVWGPDGAAMFGALRQAIERTPVVPVVVPPDLGVCLVFEDDLVMLLEKVLSEWPNSSGELFVAAAKEMPRFVELLRSLSPDGARRRFVTIPWIVAWAGLRSLETLGVRPKFPSDRLVSLVNADSDPRAHATAGEDRYGVSFRPYPAA
jgi:nucleoside-diphosphate-sugar epimerase